MPDVVCTTLNEVAGPLRMLILPSMGLAATGVCVGVDVGVCVVVGVCDGVDVWVAVGCAVLVDMGVSEALIGVVVGCEATPPTGRLVAVAAAEARVGVGCVF